MIVIDKEFSGLDKDIKIEFNNNNLGLNFLITTSWDNYI